MTHDGCPKCGSDRLKAAPRALADGLLDRFSSRRRYKCSACGWQGRRHRLRRRSQEMSGSLAPHTAPKAPAVWFAVFVVISLLLSGAVLMKNCNEGPHGLIEGPGQP